MFSTLDRMFLTTYFRSYGIIAPVHQRALFIVIDLFTHLDDFVNKSSGLAESAHHIAACYGYRTPQLFEMFSTFYTVCAARVYRRVDAAFQRTASAVVGGHSDPPCGASGAARSSFHALAQPAESGVCDSGSGRRVDEVAGRRRRCQGAASERRVRLQRRSHRRHGGLQEG